MVGLIAAGFKLGTYISCETCFMSVAVLLACSMEVSRMTHSSMIVT